jgi:hypothetical protein
LVDHENSWPFRKPVEIKKVPDYYEIIKEPMGIYFTISFSLIYLLFLLIDMEKIQKNLNDGVY